MKEGSGGLIQLDQPDFVAAKDSLVVSNGFAMGPLNTAGVYVIAVQLTRVVSDLAQPRRPRNRSHRFGAALQAADLLSIDPDAGYVEFTTTPPFDWVQLTKGALMSLNSIV